MTPQELSKSNCSGRAVKHSGRAEVRMIPADTLRYVVSTTYRMYGVAEGEQGKCYREITTAIDMHCRRLASRLNTN